MSTRRTQSLPPHMLDDKPDRGKCITAICFSWKLVSCVVSHATLVLLVVSYCVGGAYLFQYLEKKHEIEVKHNIKYLRSNLTEKIWKFSDNMSVLAEEDWVSNVKKDLASFEKQILTAIKTDGWDGSEDETKSQWTFAGSLFYSIVVITTIGYGDIAPRTDWGKVTTIFYAIVGIPLMLLCLSNIGDVMATSFRFLYWRVCCFLCTRNARPPRRSRGRSMRSHRYSGRSRLPRTYSDPVLRTAGRNDYYDDRRATSSRRHQPRPRQMPPPEPERFADEPPVFTQSLNRGSRFTRSLRNRDSMRDRHTVERERYISRSQQRLDTVDDMNDPLPKAKRTFSVRSARAPSYRRDDITNEPRERGRDREIERETRELREISRMNPRSLQRGRSVPNAPPHGRSKSVDPRSSMAHYEDVDEEMVRKTPIIPNRYAIDELDHREHHSRHMLRSQSMPRSAMHKNHFNSEHRKGNGSPYQHPHSRHQSPQPPPIDQNRHSFHRHHNSQHSRYGDRLELPEFGPPETNHVRRGRSPRRDEYEDDFNDYYMEDLEVAAYNDYREQPRYRERRHRRERTGLQPSPRIMSPMGFAVKRQVRRRPSYDHDDDSLYGDDWDDYYWDISPKDRPVPIWLCVFLVVSYILGGAALFDYWENWSFLDSAYFCFITLTTIGFGDYVPAKGVKDESEQSIAYCSLYLLFGIALLAMSFNLVQEEFIANVKEIARRLGILKDEEEDD